MISVAKAVVESKSRNNQPGPLESDTVRFSEKRTEDVDLNLDLSNEE